MNTTTARTFDATVDHVDVGTFEITVVVINADKTVSIEDFTVLEGATIERAEALADVLIRRAERA